MEQIKTFHIIQFRVVMALLLLSLSIHARYLHVPHNPKVPHFLPRNPASRKSSYPFISGDTFRSFCDHHYDEASKGIDLAQIKAGDTIFLAADYFECFFKEVFPLIKVPVILVSHNRDYEVPGIYTSYLNDERLFAWFSHNISCKHKKLVAIPIGLSNRYWPHGDINILKRIMESSVENREYFVYMNFTARTHPSRLRVWQLFKNKDFVKISQSKNFHGYLSDLKKSSFVLSPRGNGIDCHRTWEALYMGAIPIVPSTTINKVYEGLPVIIVQDWQIVDQEFLERKILEMSKNKYAMNRLFADYWFDKLRQAKFKAKVKKLTIDGQ